jgi:hypothetical protein
VSEDRVALSTDEVEALSGLIKAAREVAAAIPPPSNERLCPVCWAFSGHMGDCGLAALRVHLAALAHLVGREEEG